ncbi:protein kinase [bacterium]|nr:protein kinase [bacterium]
MALSLNCPGCGSAIPVSPGDAGKRGRCPACGHAIVAPRLQEAHADTVREPASAPPPSPFLAGASSSERLARSSDRVQTSTWSSPSGTWNQSAAPPEVEEARRDPARALGPFVLLSELGKGGMGIVFRAWDERLRRIVALKTILPGAGVDDEAVLRFRREAEAVARLRHPNIVAVHEAGELLGKHYIAMDFVEGSSLDERLRAGKGGARLPLVRAIEVLRDVARAVHYAHSQGVVHRDLKPQNVLLGPGDHAYVLDFGLASIRGTGTKLTQTGARMGTPAYMPPEQASGEGGAVDARSDVYGLGATLYHVLAGRAPFEGAMQVQVIVSVLTKDPVPPGALNPRVAGDLETICLKCLEKEPAKRYATARELADELDRWLSGEPILARPLSLVARIARRARRQKVLAGVVLVSLLAILGLGTLAAAALVQLARERERERTAELDRAHADAEKERKKAEDERAEADRQRAVATRQRARLLVDRAERAVELGRHREAAIYTAKAISLDDTRAYRAAHFVAREGPWRREQAEPDVPGKVQVVDFSRDGTRIAAGTAHGKVVVLDASSGRVLGTGDPGESGEVTDVAWSPDGKLVASASATWNPPHNAAPVIVWKADTLEIAAKLDVGSISRAIAWSPDGRRLACGFTTLEGRRLDGVRVVAWETGRVEQQLVGHRNCVTAVAWSPDGKRIASGALDQEVHLFEKDGKGPFLGSHRGLVQSLAFSPDGRRLASAGDDRVIKVFDTETRAEWSVFQGHASNVCRVAWAPDGHRLASAGMFDSVRIWNVDTGAFSAIGGGTTSLAWSPDGRALVAATSWAGATRLWQTAGDRRTVAWAAHEQDIASLAWSPDGNRIATVSGDPSNVRLWDAAQGMLIRQDGSLARLAWSVAFSPDGRRLLTTGGFWRGRQNTVKLWDADSSRMLAELKAPQGEYAINVCWSPDDRTLAWVTGRRTAWLCPLDGTAPIALDARGERVSTLVFSRDARLVAGACEDRAVRLWDARSGALLDTAHGHGAGVRSVAFDREGRYLASGSSDKTARLWDVERNGSLVKLRHAATLFAQADSVSMVAFDPAGKRLATASRDGRVTLWPLDAVLEGPPPRELLAEVERETGLTVPEGSLDPVLLKR